DLLRDDRSAEYSGKGIADGDLEFALDTLNQASLAAHVQTPASVPVSLVLHGGHRSGVSYIACRIQHGIRHAQRSGTSRTLRIESVQVKPAAGVLVVVGAVCRCAPLQW